MIALALAMALAAAPAAKPGPGLPDDVVGAAVDRFYSRTYHACFDKAVATDDMVACFSAETALWDKRLNAAYRAKMAGKDAFSPSEKADLQTAQRAWIAYRDANGRAYFHPEDWGSRMRVEMAAALLRMTAERAMELENFPPSACGEANC